MKTIKEKGLSKLKDLMPVFIEENNLIADDINWLKDENGRVQIAANENDNRHVRISYQAHLDDELQHISHVSQLTSYAQADVYIHYLNLTLSTLNKAYAASRNKALRIKDIYDTTLDIQRLNKRLASHDRGTIQRSKKMNHKMQELLLKGETVIATAKNVEELIAFTED